MAIKDFLAAEHVLVDVEASDKQGLLRDLAARAAAALDLPADRICGELLKREKLGSTGTGAGIAIPHARYRELSKPFGLFSRLARPIDFQSIDGQPVDLVLMLLLPASAERDQLNALASVARKLREPAVLRRLRDGAAAADLHRAITG
jgi:PTS system nitrogen regulatory IIA component